MLFVFESFSFYFKMNKANHGLGLSLINSIDWFFSKVKFGIILEDDLRISEDGDEFATPEAEEMVGISTETGEISTAKSPTSQTEVVPNQPISESVQQEVKEATSS